MFAKLLVEMATGKIVSNLDDISTLAASGSISISLPVLQVCRKYNGGDIRLI